MKKLALLPALLLLLAGASSCEKTQADPTPTAGAVANDIKAVHGTLGGLTQGKTVTSTNTGTYPYTVTNPITNKPETRTGTFSTALRISSFEVRNGVITALGSLAVSNVTGPAVGYTTPVAIPLALTQISSSCSQAQVTYPAQTVTLNGTSQSVNPVFTVTPNQSSKNLLGNLLCSLGVILNNPSAKDTGGVVAHLNKIISIVGQ